LKENNVKTRLICVDVTKWQKRCWATKSKPLWSGNFKHQTCSWAM